LLPWRSVVRILETPDAGAWATTEKEATVRQLTLGFVEPETRAVALVPEVEKAVVTQMAQMMADLIQKQEWRNDEQRTERERRKDAH